MAVYRLTARTLLVAATTLGIALVGSAPAGATTDPPKPAPANKLVLNVQGQSNPRLPRDTTLSCYPTGGDHPRGDAACVQLTVSGGHFRSVSPQPRACTLEYRPVTATARGTWNGKPVDYRKTFSNACELHSRTGAIFDF